MPVYYNHKPSGGRSNWKGDYVDASSAPLFAFGHGLSYTQFAYGALDISPLRVPPSGTVRISCEVANVGSRPGEEVAQLYVHDATASVTRPVKELKGFVRIALAPGERRRICFELTAAQLAFYDRSMTYVVEPGTIEVLIGSSSQDIRLTGSFAISGRRTKVRERIFTTAVTTQ